MVPDCDRGGQGLAINALHEVGEACRVRPRPLQSVTVT
jgi:hypothetical protein